MFILLLSSIDNASNDTKCVLLSNQKCMIQPTLINLHLYPFSVKFDRCVGSCNTLNTLSNKLCMANKTEDVNLSVFNMITGYIIYHANLNVNLMEEIVI